MRTYKQLTQEQRYFIYQLNKIDFNQAEIASKIGVHKSTVSREIQRNTGGNGYRPQQAHNKATDRRLQPAKAMKMNQRVVGLIEEKLSSQWSPEQVSGWLLNEHKLSPKPRAHLSAHMARQTPWRWLVSAFKATR